MPELTTGAAADVSAISATSVKVARLFKVSAWVALVLGGLMLVGGIGHMLGVIPTALRENRPYDPKMVLLLTTGGVLIYVGGVNAVLSRWIRRGVGWALVTSAVVSAALIGYLLLVRPLPDSGSMLRVSVVSHSLYLALLGIAWVRRGFD